MQADTVDQLADSLENLLGGNDRPLESEEKLIIALDFGTTYSGIVYCFASQRNPSPVAILDWPGAEGLSAPKIPTLIKYDKKDPAKFEWGASVSRQSDSIVGVKLLLDPAQERPIYLPSVNLRKDLKALPKPPVEVAGDFIGAIYRYALAEISKKVPKGYMSLCRKEYVLSVPAVWSDAAKSATLRAAEVSGISPVKLIKEPEAAALYTAKTLDFSLHCNDAFVVCDAGGGTVDLVSYEIEAMFPRLRLKELVPGTGGMAGSLGLNRRFASAVSELVGDHQWISLKRSKAFLLAENQFDREIETSFRGRREEEYFVNFPMAGLEDDPESGLESNSWRMTGDDLKEIFDPLIKDILRLIDHQVQAVKLKRGKRPVTGIFLVGGFGSSQYLKERVQKEHPGIQVLQPNDAWAAIAKGAALSMMPREAMVTSSSATRHYGVEAGEVYNKLEDKDQPTYLDRNGQTRTRRMTWYINVGDDLLRDQKIKFPFSRALEEDYDSSDLIFKDELFECKDKKAPIHRSKGEDIGINCVLRSDLSGIPESKFFRRIDISGKPYWDINYDLVVTLESAVLKFSLEIDGEGIGSVNAKFN